LKWPNEWFSDIVFGHHCSFQIAVMREKAPDVDFLFPIFWSCEAKPVANMTHPTQKLDFAPKMAIDSADGRDLLKFGN
jgi:hypothetical protein